MSEIHFEPLSINADRICEAISKIGYNPVSAIMDIVDNSFMANSKEITVKLFIKTDTTINNPKSVEKIMVVDNGEGMDVGKLRSALQLGSEVSYTHNSLSKYGLGLKSAGFSLGRRIEVTSKVKDMEVSKKYFLDRDMIKDKNVFGYAVEKPEEMESKFLSEYTSGTVITILNLIYTGRVSASKIMEELTYKAGVNYQEFLTQKGSAFKVEIFNSKGNKLLKDRVVQPKDMLSWNDAYSSFLKEEYDCKKPCKVLETFFENPLRPAGEKIKLQASIFPKDSMKSYPFFTAEEQQKIKDYEVSLKNGGFYFYRNGRLIKWGEKLFLGREYGLRVKISFTTEHDELFDVDVSKQHLTVSEEVENTLKSLITTAKNQAKELFEICDEKIKTSKNIGQEGAEFNMVNSTLEEDDDETVEIAPSVINQRKDLIEKRTEELAPDEKSYENEDTKEAFRRVRYWEGKRNLWDDGYDKVEGSYVLINKSHPFYDLVLGRLEVGDPNRQSIEAILFSLAAGRNQTIQKFNDVDGDIVLKIFEKFNRYVSHQLDNWVNNNWALFDNEDTRL